LAASGAQRRKRFTFSNDRRHPFGKERGRWSAIEVPPMTNRRSAIMAKPEHQGGPRGPDPERAEIPEQEMTEEISREILAIHNDSYGRGASSATAHLLDDTVVVLLDGLELLPAEEFLIESGSQDAVMTMRDQFQKAIEVTFRAAVERATGRRVIGFTSHSQLDEPRFSVEIFRLEPA
jgi:uncharacterized protein YbcI